MITLEVQSLNFGEINFFTLFLVLLVLYLKTLTNLRLQRVFMILAITFRVLIYLLKGCSFPFYFLGALVKN